MIKLQDAVAGTLESSDLYVEYEAGEQPLEIELRSAVLAQYGAAIRASVEAICQAEGVTQGKLLLDDRGALDCTIRARLLCCLARAKGCNEAQDEGRKLCSAQ